MVKEIGEGTKGTSPKTGDTANMIPWMILLLGAATATVAIRRKED